MLQYVYKRGNFKTVIFFFVDISNITVHKTDYLFVKTNVASVHTEKVIVDFKKLCQLNDDL